MCSAVAARRDRSDLAVSVRAGGFRAARSRVHGLGNLAEHRDVSGQTGLEVLRMRHPFRADG